MGSTVWLEYWQNYRISYKKKTEADVLRVVDFLPESASFFFVGDATQMTLQRVWRA